MKKFKDIFYADHSMSNSTNFYNKKQHNQFSALRDYNKLLGQVQISQLLYKEKAQQIEINRIFKKFDRISNQKNVAVIAAVIVIQKNIKRWLCKVRYVKLLRQLEKNRLKFLMDDMDKEIQFQYLGTQKPKESALKIENCYKNYKFCQKVERLRRAYSIIKYSKELHISSMLSRAIPRFFSYRIVQEMKQDTFIEREMLKIRKKYAVRKIRRILKFLNLDIGNIIVRLKRINRLKLKLKKKYQAISKVGPPSVQLTHSKSNLIDSQDVSELPLDVSQILMNQENQKHLLYSYNIKYLMNEIYPFENPSFNHTSQTISYTKKQKEINRKRKTKRSRYMLVSNVNKRHHQVSTLDTSKRLRSRFRQTTRFSVTDSNFLRETSASISRNNFYCDDEEETKTKKSTPPPIGVLRDTQSFHLKRKKRYFCSVASKPTIDQSRIFKHRMRPSSENLEIRQQPDGLVITDIRSDPFNECFTTPNIYY